MDPTTLHLSPAANQVFSFLPSTKYLRYTAAVGLALLVLELSLFTDWTVGLDSIDNYTKLINSYTDTTWHSGHLSSNNNKPIETPDKYFESPELFVHRALESGIYVEEYNGKPVRDLCAHAKWRQGLFVSCDRIGGGIGNLKENLLGCARYAIEAGAALVTPVIHPRETFGIMEFSFGWDIDLPLDYMFDSEHFYSTLQSDCPQLRFVNDTDPDVPPPTSGIPLKVKELEGTKSWYLLYPEKWRDSLDAWLLAESGTFPSKQAPVRLSFNAEVQFTWPTAYDGPDFRRDWGLAAQFPRDIRELGARILYELYQQAGCAQDPSTISRQCFLGVHLRTEADAVVEHWESYESQLAHVREQLIADQLSVLYVATGQRNDFERLRADVSDLMVLVDGIPSPVRVLEKRDLANEMELARLDELAWDQLAIVDLEVMLRASRFSGLSTSSWSWMVALTRHLHTPADPYQGLVTFEDGLSVLYGTQGQLPMIEPTFYP